MRHLIKKAADNPYIGGGVFLLFANLLMGGMNYLFNMLASRYLGPTGYGEITTLFAYQAVLNIPFSVASLLVIQRMGTTQDDPYTFAISTEHTLFRLLKKYRLGFVLFWILIPISPYIFNLPWYSAYSLMFLLGITVIAVVYDSLLMGLEIFFLPALIGLLSVGIKLGGLWGSVFGIPPVIAVILAYDLSTLCKFGMIVFLFRKRVQNKKDVSISDKKYSIQKTLLQKDTLLLVVTVASTSLLSSVDTIVLNWKLSAGEIGLYNVWAMSARLILFAAGPVLTLSYIFFTKKTHNHLHDLISIIFLTLIAIGGSGIFWIYRTYGETFIRVFYGYSYFPLVPYRDWAALFGTGLVMSTFLHNYFLTRMHKATYILPIFTGIYICVLLTIVHSISDMMLLNTIAVALLCGCYCCVVLFHVILKFNQLLRNI